MPLSQRLYPERPSTDAAPAADAARRQARARRHGRRKVVQAKSALWNPLGGDPLPAVLALLAVFLPLTFARFGEGLLGGGAAALALVLLRRREPVDLRRGPLPWLLALAAWDTAAALRAGELHAGETRAALTVLALSGAGLAVYAAAARTETSRRVQALWDALTATVLLSSLLTLALTLTPLGGAGSLLTARNAHRVKSGQTHLSRLRVQIEDAPVAGTGQDIGSPPGSPRRSPLGDPLWLAAFLTPLFPLLAVAAAGPARPARRLAALAALLAGGGALAVTDAFPFARPGLGAGLLVLGALNVRDTWRGGLPRGIVLAWGSAAALGLLALLSACFPVSLFRWPADGGLPGLALRAGALGAFFLAAGGALRRLPVASLRRRALVGITAGVAGQAAAAFSPAGGDARAVYFFWLLLGLGMACAGVGPAGGERPGHTDRSSL